MTEKLHLKLGQKTGKNSKNIFNAFFITSKNMGQNPNPFLTKYKTIFGKIFPHSWANN